MNFTEFMNTPQDDNFELVFRNGLREKSKKAFERIQKQNRVFVACSGGGDSIALTYLSSYFLGMNFKGLIYFDHGQRPREEVQREVSLVESTAVKLHVMFFKGEIPNPQRGASENSLREKRYGFFERFAKDNKALILLGHNLDDRIETFFFNLMRGTGLNGLISIRERRSFYFRPLLSVTRSAIRAFLTDNSIEFSEDSTNELMDFKRNRIRKSLMPVFGEISGRDYRVYFERLFAFLEQDEKTLEQIEERLLNDVAWLNPEGYTINLKELRKLPCHLKRRMLRKAALKAGHLSIDSNQTERLYALASGLAGTRLDSGDVKAKISRGRLLIFKRR
ncbi:tRNA lysidine(34) synthetase TilS [candidate division WOR-3 bacterium]|nr:tRNA lysidine(34) synthetase TilS [candidate division WOR-3 bacterium]